MAALPGPARMTGDELVQHRLVQLEEWRVEASSTVRSAERDVDLLKLESATVKSLLVEHRTETKQTLDQLSLSLVRIHERLDTITTAESFEKGREAGTSAAQTRTWKVVAWSVMATITSSGVIVALLALVLNHH